MDPHIFVKITRCIMKYNMFYERKLKKGDFMSDNIKMMKVDWNELKNEINGMAKTIPAILKANGAEFDIFSANCPPGVMELVGSYLRLMRRSDEFVTHCLNMYEEQSRKMDRIQNEVEHIKLVEARRYDALMSELKEVKELLKKKDLPAVIKQ